MPSSAPCHEEGAGGIEPNADGIGGGPRPGSGKVIAEGGGSPL